MIQLNCITPVVCFQIESLHAFEILIQLCKFTALNAS